MPERDTSLDGVFEVLLAAIRRIEARDPEKVRGWMQVAQKPRTREQALADIEAAYAERVAGKSADRGRACLKAVQRVPASRREVGKACVAE